MHNRILRLASLAILASAGVSLAQTGGTPAGSDPPAATPEGPSDSSFGDTSSFGEEVETPEDKKTSSKKNAAAKAGTVSGQVIAGAKKSPIVDAQIVVVGRPERAVADHDGKFSLDLPPGTYSLRVFYPGYRSKRLDNVRVAGSGPAVLSVSLDPDKAAAEEIVLKVEAEPDRRSAATQLMLRRKSAATSDAISAQDIARTPDRSASESARRIVGATVVDNRFVFVRGLGDRYTNSLLNGTPLPSPEPDVQAIPLDLFPTAVLSDLTILKTFTPDMPGNFAGGSVRINTRTFPEKFLFEVTGTGGFNTQSTFRERTSYGGGSTDWLGIDDGSRALPRDLEARKNIVNQNTSAADLERLGEKLDQGPRRLRETTTLPNHSLTIVSGNRYKAGAQGEWGWLASATYGRSFEVRNERQALYTSDVANGRRFLVPSFEFDGRRSLMNVRLGALGTLGWNPTPDHRLSLTTLYSRNADDEVLRLQGYEQDDATDQRVVRSRWLEREMLFTQLRGNHVLKQAGAARADWNVFFGRASRNEPNLVQSVYAKGSDGRFSALQDDGLTHFFAGQSEKLYGGGADWTQPLTSGGDNGTSLKAGFLLQHKDRDFSSRRFRFLPQRGIGDRVFLPPEVLTRAENIGPEGVLLDENTRSSDTYTAAEGVYAGYLMADARLTKRLRAIVGERVEHGRINVDSFDPVRGGAPVSAGFRKTDLLPSASLIYALTGSMNLRASATRTVARPQFREIAPFEYSSFFNAPEVKGNPDLTRTRITNLDLRWELFPSAEEVLAASVFYKHFEDPIEQTILPTSNVNLTFENSKAARNLGGELEARKALGFLHPSLAGFAVLANLTVVHSRVELGESSRDIVSTPQRPLQGQSPYAINAAIDWTPRGWGLFARLSYNVMGRRLAAVARTPLPNIHERPRHMLDLSIGKELGEHFTVKGSIQNLLDSPYVLEQQDKVTTRFKTGTTFLVAVTGKL